MLSDWGNARISFNGFITFLEDYAASDFSAEEAFMLHHACPEYQQHKQQHAMYLSILSGLKQGLAGLGPFYVLSVRISQIAINRIFSHILNTDKKPRTYLRESIQLLSGVQAPVAKLFGTMSAHGGFMLQFQYLMPGSYSTEPMRNRP